MNTATGRAADGGGIRTSGLTVIVDAQIIGNEAIGSSSAGDGGGVFAAAGTLTIVNSSVTGNLATGTTLARGGGVFTNASTTIVRTALTGNEAESAGTTRGGGISADAGALTVRNVVFGGNQAADGTHLFWASAGSLDLEWNFWNAGGAPAADDIEGASDPDEVCPDADCFGVLAQTVLGLGSVAFDHDDTNDAAFAAALDALALVYGDDFTDFVVGFAANFPPECESDSFCTWALPLGLDIELTATPLGGSTFSGWESCDTGTTPITLTIEGLHTCTAVFLGGLTPWPVIAPAAPPAGVVGEAYALALLASGGVPDYAWDISAGVLPPGLTLNATSGLISGVPGVAGTFDFTVRVTGENSASSTRALSIAVFAAPVEESDLAVATTALLEGTVGLPYGQYLFADGGSPPYSWVVSTGSLPAGLSLNASTGLISGTPTAAGTFGFIVTVTDGASDTAQRSLGIVVHAAPETPAEPTPPPSEDTMPPGCVLNQAPGFSGVYLLVVVGTACGVGELPQATSYWVTSGGSFVGFVPGAPAWVNQQFLALVQPPGLTTGTPLILVRR